MAKTGGDQKKLAACQADIVSGEVIVFVEDECHLSWGDAIGYVWGRQHERTEVPVANAKQRQTIGVRDFFIPHLPITIYLCALMMSLASCNLDQTFH